MTFDANYQRLLNIGHFYALHIPPLSAYEIDRTEWGISLLGQQAAKPLLNVPRGENNLLVMSEGAKLSNCHIDIIGSNNVVFFGGHCAIDKGLVRMIGNDGMFLFGAFSTAADVIIQCRSGQIIIADDCMFSNRIIIDNSDHHPIFDRQTGARINPNGDIILNRNVWVCRDVKISKGAVIGHESIIGESSLVSGEIPPHSLAAGMPARVIRDNVTWSRFTAESLEELENNAQYIADVRRKAEYVENDQQSENKIIKIA